MSKEPFPKSYYESIEKRWDLVLEVLEIPLGISSDLNALYVFLHALKEQLSLQESRDADQGE